MRTYAWCTVLYCVLGLSFAGDGDAAIYKYVDKYGIVCFADDLQAVPQKYRSTAVIVEGEAKEEPKKESDSAASHQEAVSIGTGESSKTAWRSRPFSFRLMISAAISLVAYILFLTITRQSKLRENEKFRSIIRASLAGMVSVFLVVAHARDVMTIFGMAGKAIDEVEQRSAEKGKKAAQAIKKIDALLDAAEKAQEALPAREDDHK